MSKTLQFYPEIVTRPVIDNMASIIRVICFRVRPVKCALSVLNIAIISFMVSLGADALLERVF